MREPRVSSASSQALPETGDAGLHTPRSFSASEHGLESSSDREAHNRVSGGGIFRGRLEASPPGQAAAQLIRREACCGEPEARC